MQQPQIETTCLELRPFTPADAPAVQRLASEHAVADTTLNIPHPYPDGAAETWIASHPEDFRAGMGVTFALALRETGELCGSLGLTISPRHAHAELGYWLGVPYWNRGYATEAATALLTYGFTVLGLHRIYASYFARNPASGRVLQKLGMTLEGTQREHLRKGERFEDVVTYGILCHEWRPKANDLSRG
jgi:RimJ/RimL family protein N-acetyltransferase